MTKRVPPPAIYRSRAAHELPPWVCRTGPGTEADKDAGLIVRGTNCEREAVVMLAYSGSPSWRTYACIHHAPHWIFDACRSGWEPIEYRPQWYVWKAWLALQNL